VLVVSNGDATAFLTQEAVNGLRAMGAEVTLDRLRGHYFALIGVQGAPTESASVVVDAHEAFLGLTLNRDRRHLAGAVDWVKIERSQ